MITEINKSKVLIKHISCKNKCRFDGTKCNSDQWWNSDKYHVKNVMYVKKIMFEILLHVIAKMKNIQQVLWMIQQFFVIKFICKGKSEGQQQRKKNKFQ